jgi:hypothetical protein
LARFTNRCTSVKALPRGIHTRRYFLIVAAVEVADAELPVQVQVRERQIALAS